MSRENRDKTSRLEPSEYTNHVDRRCRQKEHLLTAPFIDSNNFDRSKIRGKHHQPAVQFRISPFAVKVGDEVAALFGLSLSQYCKCLLYLNLGLIFEPVDRRRKRK